MRKIPSAREHRKQKAVPKLRPGDLVRVTGYKGKALVLGRKSKGKRLIVKVGVKRRRGLVGGEEGHFENLVRREEELTSLQRLSDDQHYELTGIRQEIKHLTNKAWQTVTRVKIKNVPAKLLDDKSHSQNPKFRIIPASEKKVARHKALIGNARRMLAGGISSRRVERFLRDKRVSAKRLNPRSSRR